MQSQNQTEQADQVAYVTFTDLCNPDPNAITYQSIQTGLQSKDWKTNFYTLTNLRQANRYYANLFLQQLLPRSYRQIIQQIDNLRSNNSKQSLTLVSEMFEHQNLETVSEEVMGSLTIAIFGKTVSEKGFLKKQALKAVSFIPKKFNSCLVKELSTLTQSNNGHIAELAIKTLTDYISSNKVLDFSPQFYQILAINLEGKRALLQRKAKQILQDLKNRKGEQNLTQQAQILLKQHQLSEQHKNLIIRQLKKQNSKKSPAQQNFRDFLKLKKKSETA